MMNMYLFQKEHNPGFNIMSKLSDNIERKFIESYDISDYEILTDTRLVRYK
jgi:hypothetical protein